MEIEFCECGGIMVPDGKRIKCRSCGKIKEKKMEAVLVTKQEKKDMLVIENNDPDLPTVEQQCEKCGNDRAFFFVKQTRSSDEPPTRFLRCTKCKYTWREYQ